MDKTETTPIDYKQFEGHTPGPWIVRTAKEFIKPKAFEIINHDGLLIASVNIGMFDVEQNSKLLASAPDLLKENQSLKLELQKQKGINAELVEGVESLVRLFYAGYTIYPKDLESLIKKSKEL